MKSSLRATLLMDAIEGINSAKTSTDVHGVVSNLFFKFGYDRYMLAGGHRTPHSTLKQRIILSSWPSTWVEQHVTENLAVHDPITRNFDRAKASFRWQDVEVKTNCAARVMEIAAKDHKLVEGLGVPIFGPYGRLGGLSISGQKTNQSRGATVVIEAIAFYVFNHVHLHNIRMPSRSLLTERQREMLLWVAAGKTDCDIAAILNLSHETVNKTVAAAVHRLDACTRSQAVVEAIRLNEIKP